MRPYDAPALEEITTDTADGGDERDDAELEVCDAPTAEHTAPPPADKPAPLALTREKRQSVQGAAGSYDSNP